jgi:cold shock CspA family protein/ribosome-associated translation inhibitor RaiA
MRVPLEITFRGIPPNEDIKELIRQKAAKLDRVAEQLISCRVAVEKKQKHPQSGNPYRVRINMRMPPGRELVVNSGESGEGFIHDDLSTVVREVFEIALRQLKKSNGQLQADVKEHPMQEASGIVVRLFNDNGYGFLKTLTGREIFFHRNSVLNDDFDRLEVGVGVRFVEEDGEKGPQASTVQIIDKPGVRGPKTDDEPVELPIDWKE